MEIRQPNPPRTTATVWWIITAAAILAVVIPFLLDIENSTGLILVVVAGFLLAIIGLIIAIIYQMRAAKLDSILKGDNLLAQWTYTPDEWQQFAEEEYQRQKKNNLTLFIIITIVTAILGFGFWLFNRKMGMVIFLTVLGALALVGLIAWFTAFYNHRQNKRIQGQAFFTPDAVYINRQLHDFKSMMSKLEKTELKGDSQQYIEFTYSAPTRNGRQNYEARVPVPRGKEQEARELVQKYQGNAGNV